MNRDVFACIETDLYLCIIHVAVERLHPSYAELNKAQGAVSEARSWHGSP